MKLFLSPTEDTTLYQRYPNNNSGLDEIIEVGKTVASLDSTNMYASASSRALINFDTTDFSQYPENTKYYLNLKIANAKNVRRYQELEVYLVSGSWIEGSGYFYQDIRNLQDGASWSVKNANVSWSNAGGDYYANPSASYTMTRTPIEDVQIDVTQLLTPVISGSITFNGFIVKFPDADEIDSSNTGNIKFFSINTHTIFAPTLEVNYVDQVFITGSLKPIPNGNVTVIPRNLKQSYTRGEVDKVYFVVRDRFPDKRFDAVQRYRTQYYLPSESYVRIRDDVSNVTLYDFDQYSAISCNTSGSYVVLNTTQFEPNRYYTMDLKVKSGNLTFFPEFKYTFTIDDDE